MKNDPTTSTYMAETVREALIGMTSGSGGPFGAIIVHEGRIISRAHNMVLESFDPTAHAEIAAIRMASSSLKRFDLSGCVIYSSCEPCPMCFAAIFWARIPKLIYANTREEAKNIGFDDNLLYDILSGKSKNRQFESIRVCEPGYMKPFEEWMKKTDRTPY
jgi:guanine deaminase